METIAAQAVGGVIIGIVQADTQVLVEGASPQHAAGAIPAAMTVSAAAGALPAPPIARAGIVGGLAAVGYEVATQMGGEWLQDLFNGLGSRLRGER